MNAKWDIRDVQETVLVFVFVVDTAHEGGGRRQDLVDKDEDGLLWAKLDSLANNVDELANGQIGRDEVLLLVDCRDVRFLDFLADDLDTCQRHLLQAVDSGKIRTGMRSAYFCRMRSASALRFSSLCSSLNLDRMLAVIDWQGLIEVAGWKVESAGICRRMWLWLWMIV